MMRWSNGKQRERVKRKDKNGAFEQGEIWIDREIHELIAESETSFLQSEIAKMVHDHARGEWGKSTTENQKHWNRQNISKRSGKVIATYQIDDVKIKIETVFSMEATTVKFEE